MAEIKEYFESNRYQPTFFLGDRVEGKYNKIPFRGTVSIDTEQSTTAGPFVRVWLDLPIVAEGRELYTLVLKPKELKLVK